MGLIDEQEAMRRLASLRLPEDAQRLLLEPQFWHEPVVRIVGGQTDRLMKEDPKAALALAETVMALARKVSPEHCHARQHRSLQAYGVSVYGSSMRSLGQHQDARAAYIYAGFLLERDGAVRDKADLYLRFAGLETYECNFAEAIRYADEAVKLYRFFPEEPQLLGTAFLVRSTTYHRWGRVEASIRDVGAALSHLDPDDDSYLHYLACHRWAVLLMYWSTSREELEEAARVVRDARSRMPWKEDSAAAMKVRWIEGWIASRLGNVQTGLTALLEAYQGLKRHEAKGDLLLLAIDIAAILVRQGNLSELKAHAGLRLFPLLPFVRSISRSAYRELVKLQTAMDTGRADEAMFDQARRVIATSPLAA